MDRKVYIRKTYLLLLLILLIGFSLRFAGFLRDEPVSYHPDGHMLKEKIQAMLEFTDRRDTNHYAWPGETIYSFYTGIFFFLRLIGTEITPKLITKTLQFNSIIFGTLTIYIVYLLTRRLYTTRAALFASALFAVLMYSVIISHYETTDATATFFMTLFYMSLIPLIRRPHDADSSLAQSPLSLSGKLRINKTLLFIALVFVLSTFTKWSGLTLLYPLVAALALHFGFIDDLKQKKISISKVKSAAKVLAIIFIFAGILSVMIWPAWPFRFMEILGWIKYDSLVHRTGHFGLFPTAGKGVLDFQLSTFPILRVSVGIAFTILAFFSMAFLFFRRRKEDLLIASSALVYLLFIGMYPVRLNRYYVLIFPLLAIMSGEFLDTLVQHKQKLIKAAGWGTFAVVFIMSLSLSVAHVSILVNEDVRVTAGDWIDENIPPGSSIMIAPYSLTHALPVFSYQNYVINSGTPEYIILPEPNTFVYLRYVHERDRFRPEDWRNKPPPDEVLQFYDAVYGEKAGYTLAKAFAVTPHIGPLVYTEDKNLLYDLWSMTHPEVRIYKRQTPPSG